MLRQKSLFYLGLLHDFAYGETSLEAELYNLKPIPLSDD